MYRMDTFKKSWKRTGSAAALFGCVVSIGFVASLGGSVWTAFFAAILTAALFFGLYGGLIMITMQLDWQMEHAVTELRAMVNIRPLAGYFPLSFGGWAMDAALGETIAQQIALHKPRLVLECGSGTSTAFIAACLNQFCSGGRVVSLEHDPEYAERTRQLLYRAGLMERCEVIAAPLCEHQIEGKTMNWYSFDPAALGAQRIDLLIVDGPPGHQSPFARYPAVPMLGKHLSPNVTIIMDDGNRSDERRIARKWADNLGGSLRYINTSKGLWTIHRAGSG